MQTWLLATLLTTCLTNCADPGDGPVKADDPHAPVVNPNPQHTVRVFGTIDPGLQVKLVAGYEAESSSSECWTEAPLWKGGGEKFKNERLVLKRDGDRFETTVVVDKYLSGTCKWRLIVVKAGVWNDADPNGHSQVVIEGRDFNEPEDAPRCPAYASLCTEERARRLTNSDDSIRAEVRCKMMLPGETISGQGGLDCANLKDDGYKKRHLVKPYTRQVELSFKNLQLLRPFDPDVLEKTIHSAKDSAL